MTAIALRPFASLTIMLSLGAAAVAHASPAETFDGLVLQPSDPKLIALTFDQGFGGVVISRDSGHSFQLRPAISFTSYGIRSRPPAVYTNDDTLVIGQDEGLFADDGKGCNFTQSQTVGTAPVEDIQLHPSDKSIAFVVTATGSVGRGGLWQRAADGTVMPLGPADSPSFAAYGLRVIARAESMGGLRFFEVGGVMPNLAPTNDAGLGDAGSNDAASASGNAQVLRVSDDLGATRQTHAVKPDDGQIRLLAVDPLDPNRIVVGISREGLPDPPDSVLISMDGGATFTSYLEGIGEVGQTAIAADGRFWLAGSTTAPSGGGLWFAPRIGEPLTQLLNVSTLCVGHDDATDTLYVCKASEFGQLDKSGNYCRMTRFFEVTGFATCSGEDLFGNQDVRQQLCNAWCGSAHYSWAPICGLYDLTLPVACGLPARQIDDQLYGWSDGPPDDGTPRCPGFPGPQSQPIQDAGAAPQNDAGSVATLDGGVDSGVTVAGGSGHHDSGCSLGGSTRASSGFAWAALASALLLGERRRSRNRGQ